MTNAKTKIKLGQPPGNWNDAKVTSKSHGWQLSVHCSASENSSKVRSNPVASAYAAASSPLCRLPGGGEHRDVEISPVVTAWLLGFSDIQRPKLLRGSGATACQERDAGRETDLQDHRPGKTRPTDGANSIMLTAPWAHPSPSVPL